MAFAGRSNVGKSSVINKITNRKSLARTSKSPGRTQQLNYFTYADHQHIVDLPGYGYAKVSPELQQTWKRLLEYYFKNRQSLRGIFLIMDIRHPMEQFDRTMLKYCQNFNRPLHIILNKSDKLSKQQATETITKIKAALQSPQISIQLFSALNGSGTNEARERLADWLFN